METKENKLIVDCKDCLFKLCCKDTISQDDFNTIFQRTIQQTYKRREVIFKQGMKTDYLVYLSDGIVKFNYEDENGKNLILTITKSPTLLGLTNVLNEDVNVFSIIAIDDCKGCLIDLKKLKNFVFSNQLFMLSILKLSTTMFRSSVFNFISLANKRVIGRIADVLIYLSKNIYNTHEFILTMSRQEFAEFAGCSKENVIHTLQIFNEDGIINLNGKQIEIIDFERLQKISKNS